MVEEIKKLKDEINNLKANINFLNRNCLANRILIMRLASSLGLSANKVNELQEEALKLAEEKILKEEGNENV